MATVAVDAPAGSNPVMNEKPGFQAAPVTTMAPANTLPFYTRSAKDLSLHLPLAVLNLIGCILILTWLIWVACTLDGQANGYMNLHTYDQWIAMLLILLYTPVAFIFSGKIALPYNQGFQAFLTTASYVYMAGMGSKVIDTRDLTDHSGLYAYLRVGFVGWVCALAGNLIILLINIPTVPSVWTPASPAVAAPTHGSSYV